MSGNGSAGLFLRLFRALGHSLAGLGAAVRHEAAFRQEIVLALLLVPVALWLGAGAVEQVLLLAALVVVLITELLNSAIEAAVDRMGEERHPLAGRAKDLGSAAVLLSLLLWAIIWGFLALPPLLARF